MLRAAQCPAARLSLAPVSLLKFASPGIAGRRLKAEAASEMSCLGRDRTFGQSVLQNFANQFRHALAEHLCSLAKPSLLIGIEADGQCFFHGLQCKTRCDNRSICIRVLISPANLDHLRARNVALPERPTLSRGHVQRNA